MNPAKYLKTLKKKILSIVSNILCTAGATAKQAFLELYDVWFNENGNPTSCLQSAKE